MLTLVCITCGNEMFFTDKPPRDDEPCSRCGGTVFRSFFTPTVRDDATEVDARGHHALDFARGGSSESTAGDVRELNNP